MGKCIAGLFYNTIRPKTVRRFEFLGWTCARKLKEYAFLSFLLSKLQLQPGLMNGTQRGTVMVLDKRSESTAVTDIASLIPLRLIQIHLDAALSLLLMGCVEIQITNQIKSQTQLPLLRETVYGIYFLLFGSKAPLQRLIEVMRYSKCLCGPCFLPAMKVPFTEHRPLFLCRCPRSHQVWLELLLTFS